MPSAQARPIPAEEGQTSSDAKSRASPSSRLRLDASSRHHHRFPRAISDQASSHRPATTILTARAKFGPIADLGSGPDELGHRGFEQARSCPNCNLTVDKLGIDRARGKR